MAPLDGVTSANAYKLVGLLLVAGSLWLGIAALYRGVTQSPDDLFLGVDTEFLWGVYWLLVAGFWAFLFRQIARREAATSD